LAWYGEINYDNNPNDEMNKFIWLKNQNLISEDDLNEFEAKLIAYHQNGQPAPFETQHAKRTMN
jgi:hypothetical protein